MLRQFESLPGSLLFLLKHYYFKSSIICFRFEKGKLEAVNRVLIWISLIFFFFQFVPGIKRKFEPTFCEMTNSRSVWRKFVSNRPRTSKEIKLQTRIRSPAWIHQVSFSSRTRDNSYDCEFVEKKKKKESSEKGRKTRHCLEVHTDIMSVKMRRPFAVVPVTVPALVLALLVITDVPHASSSAWSEISFVENGYENVVVSISDRLDKAQCPVIVRNLWVSPPFFFLLLSFSFEGIVFSIQFVMMSVHTMDYGHEDTNNTSFLLFF